VKRTCPTASRDSYVVKARCQIVAAPGDGSAVVELTSTDLGGADLERWMSAICSTVAPRRSNVEGWNSCGGHVIDPRTGEMQRSVRRGIIQGTGRVAPVDIWQSPAGLSYMRPKCKG
jgi:hypothetical protein